MPTAGRLFGAITFALLGAYLATITAPIFEEGKLPSYWWPLSIGAGIYAGWFVVGSRVGDGVTGGISAGLTGVAAQVFWILFLFGFLLMIQKSLRKAYDGPVEAVINVFEQMYEQALALYSPQVVATILIGGVICGLISDFFARRFP